MMHFATRYSFCTSFDFMSVCFYPKGYKCPLCGSCKRSYGLSRRFQCFSCPRRFASVLTLLASTLYLLASSAITTRGTLPSPSITPKTSSTRGQQSNAPSTSSQHAAMKVEIEEGLSQESTDDEESGTKSNSIVNRSLPSKPMNGYELLRWKTTEIIKV